MSNATPATPPPTDPQTAAIERIVDARVRLYLFNLKFLGVFGAVLLGLLIYFHKDLINGLVSYGGHELRESIGRQNTGYLSEYKTQVGQHLQTLQSMQRDLMQAEARIKATNDTIRTEQDRFASKMADFREEYLRRAAALRQDADDAGKKVADLINLLNEASEVTRTRIVDAQKRATEEANQRIDAIEKRIAALQTTLVADLKDRGVDKSVPKILTPISARVDEPTVYFQFAGFAREEAQAISKAISTRGGWSIPGEERTPKAVRTNEVRYNEKDRAAAQRLVRDANEALRSLNHGITVDARENPTVRAGFLEVWVYKP